MVWPESHMSVLRNRVGARACRTRDAGRHVEAGNQAPARISLLGDRTRSHAAGDSRQLFQDIYVWAGDLRTVGIEGGRVFLRRAASVGPWACGCGDLPKARPAQS